MSWEEKVRELRLRKSIFLTPFILNVLEQIRKKHLVFNLSRFVRISILRHYLNTFKDKNELLNELKNIIKNTDFFFDFEVLEIKSVLGEDVFNEIENEIFNKVTRGAGKSHAP